MMKKKIISILVNLAILGVGTYGIIRLFRNYILETEIKRKAIEMLKKWAFINKIRFDNKQKYINTLKSINEQDRIILEERFIKPIDNILITNKLEGYASEKYFKYYWDYLKKLSDEEINLLLSIIREIHYKLQ